MIIASFVTDNAQSENAPINNAYYNANFVMERGKIKFWGLSVGSVIENTKVPKSV